MFQKVNATAVNPNDGLKSDCAHTDHCYFCDTGDWCSSCDAADFCVFSDT
ncbi:MULTISPECIES: freyrasin family ranthipeptide [Paenibacillus]